MTVQLLGAGGVGKTRLALDVAHQLDADRVRFIDERTPVDSDRLHAELAGADRLVLVVDNAHRRDDLGVLVGLLARRKGEAAPRVPAGLQRAASPGD